MKVYVCPICDHVMAGKYYCRNCHQLIRNPYYIEKNYSLDRVATELEIKTDSEMESEWKSKEKKTKEQESYAKINKKPKNKKTQKAVQKRERHYHIVWLIIIYFIFQIGIVIYSNLPKDSMHRLKNEISELFSEKKQPEDINLGEGNTIEISNDWSYEKPDYDEILEKGKESTGLAHFAIDGKEFIENIHLVLNDSDFDVIESAEHIENYIAFNSEQSEEYSYFQSIQTFYLSEDFTEYYRIVKDSVSGRLIDTEIESADFDQVCFFIRAAASILFPNNKRKLKREEKLDSYLERLLGEETYFSEKIGTMIISGYTYTNQNKVAFHISLSSAENA